MPKPYDITLTINKQGKTFKIQYDKSELDLFGENWYIVNNVALISDDDGMTFRVRDLIACRMFKGNSPIRVYHLNRNKFDFRRKNLLTVLAGGKQ